MLTRDFLVSPDGGPTVTAASDLRFRLDEDRIRAFLMGENLYGEPSLALRELYQNSLDACRLAAARRAYLHLAPSPSSAEAPEIEFEQGVDAEGRAYVDCVDHGAGMGVEELTLAFCQAGVRASDLPDRAAELADFGATVPPIELWQNSRFGIGVMSYFMIADAVTVNTSRLNRDGTVGSFLSMHIAGPASTFEVIDHGQATTTVHGTRVRLWLKPNVAVSAVSTLRDLVLVSTVYLRVADQRGLEHRWVPNELNAASTRMWGASRGALTAIPGRVWWVSDLGTILADGIWAEGYMRGMIVNLDGPLAPQLTADRNNIVRADHAAIEELGVLAAGNGIEQSWNIVGRTTWLVGATQQHHRVADAVIERAKRGNLRVKLAAGSISVAISGYMPSDEESHSGARSTELLAWRFSRFAAAGRFSSLGIPRQPKSGVIAARPSDAILLGTLTSHYVRDQELETSRWFGNATSLYEAELHLEYPMRDIITRVRELGLPLPMDADDLPESTRVVRTILSFSRRESSDGTFRPLGVFDIAQASWQLAVSARDICEELIDRSIEFDPTALDALEQGLDTNTLIAASENADGIAPWLIATNPVGLDHIVRVSRATQQAASNVVEWLRELGYCDLPALNFAGREFTDEDLCMLSRDFDGIQPFLDSARPLKPSHLAKAAKKLKEPEAELVRRYASFGVTVADADGPRCRKSSLRKKELYQLLDLTGERRAQLLPRHLEMISRDGDSRAPWLNPSEPISAWAVATLAFTHKRSLDEVLSDYFWLGYRAEDPRVAPLRLAPGP